MNDQLFINEKSLSLDNSSNHEGGVMILDELFSNRETIFNASELDRLCDTSGIQFERQSKNANKNEKFDKNKNFYVGGMNDDYIDD